MTVTRSVLAVLPGKTEDERILALRVEYADASRPEPADALPETEEEAEVLSLEAFRRSRPEPPPSPTYELCYQSWADRIGWFTQQRVPVTAEQAESLRNVFAAFAGDARPGRKSASLSATRRDQGMHVGSA